MGDEKITENTELRPESGPDGSRASAGGFSYQYHPSMNPAPPSFDPKGGAEGRRGKKRPPNFGLRRAGALIIILAVAVAALGCLLFGLKYSVEIDREGGFGIKISRRNSASGGGAAEDGGEKESAFPQASVGPGGGAAPSGASGGGAASLDLAPSGVSGPELDYGQIYDKCAPSVVGVTAYYASGGAFGGFFGGDGSAAGETRVSGIVMSEDGYIITVCSAVMAADRIGVEYQGAEREASLVGLDYATDIAVLKIDAAGLDLAAAEFGSSEEAVVGDAVAVVGNPVEGAVNLFGGMISAVNEAFSYKGYPMKALHVAMSLGSGASGSPLTNMRGQVIGVIDMALSEDHPEAGSVCFALPVSELKPVVDELLEHGYIAGRPASGIAVGNISPSAAVIYGFPEGVIVTGVQRGSTAEKAGVRRGDVIYEANGRKIGSSDELYAVINGMSAGEELSLGIYRDGERGEIAFELMEAFAPDKD